jgi:hypothetical protein
MDRVTHGLADLTEEISVEPHKLGHGLGQIECQHLMRRLSKRVGVPARHSHHSDLASPNLAWQGSPRSSLTRRLKARRPWVSRLVSVVMMGGSAYIRYQICPTVWAYPSTYSMIEFHYGGPCFSNEPSGLQIKTRVRASVLSHYSSSHFAPQDLKTTISQSVLKIFAMGRIIVCCLPPLPVSARMLLHSRDSPGGSAQPQVPKKPRPFGSPRHSRYFRTDSGGRAGPGAFWPSPKTRRMSSQMYYWIVIYVGNVSVYSLPHRAPNADSREESFTPRSRRPTCTPIQWR